MDDCLSPESLSEAALRTLLTRERAHRQDLEQEVVRLQAGLARQNAVMIQLQQRDATRERELSEYRTLVAGLTGPGTRVRVCVLRHRWHRRSRHLGWSGLRYRTFSSSRQATRRSD